MQSTGTTVQKKKNLCNTCGKKLHVLDIMEASVHSKNVILFHKAQLLISTCWFYLYSTHPMILLAIKKRDLLNSTQNTVDVQ